MNEPLDLEARAEPAAPAWPLGETLQRAARPDALERAIRVARDALLGLQQPDGHWVF